MNLMIDNYGVYIDVDNDMFRMTLEENIRKISPLKISSINLLKPCSITTPALILAAKNQIPVLLFNSFGKVEAWIWSSAYGSIATIRKNQVYFCDSSEGMQWIQEILQQKTENQLKNLRWLSERKKKYSADIQASQEKIQAIVPKFKGATLKNIRGFEGSISKEYWQCIASALEKNVVIEGRVKRYAKDAFNQHLNYLYGMLYGTVEASLLMNGIDPYIGVLHRIEHNRKAMLYDFIEPFRPWIDQVLMQLFISGKIIENIHYSLNDLGSIVITSEGKKQIINKYYEFMDEKIYLGQKRIKRVDHIHYYSQTFAQYLKNYRHDTSTDML